MGDRNVLRDTDTRQGASSKSIISEAATQLKQYLYLSKTSNIVEAVTLAGTPESVSAAVTKENTNNQDLLTRIKSVFLDPEPQTDKTLSDAQKEQEDQNPSNDFGSPTVKLIAPNQYIAGLAAGLPKDRASTSLITSIVLTDTGQANNFSSRGAEYVAIFSNLMPTVELSKCVPYFNLKLIQNTPNDNKVSMPFLSIDSFLGAIRKNTGVQGGSRETPNASITSPVGGSPTKINTTVSGMELFQAPQTLTRPSLNTLSNYKTQRGIQALDTMQPLASIESINFDVSALSQNFMTTNTKIDMSIILHDKSRLAELSPLLSPGVYPTVQAEIEWGWSHPDTSYFSPNQYAKFLNALRNKQIFSITSVSFSNRDSTAISIKLQLTGLGESLGANTSIYTGDYVSYELIRAKMNQFFTIIDDKPVDGLRKQKFIGAYEQEVSLSNWESSNKWVKYTDYKTLVALLDKAVGSPADVRTLVDFYGKILNGSTDANTSAGESPNLSIQLQNDLRECLMSGSVIASPHITAPYSDVIQGYMNGILDDMFFDVGNYTTTETKNGDGTEATSVIIGPTVTFGDAFYRFYSEPMSLTDAYDEIRVTMFDFNDHAGKMGGLNIGSFPFLIADVARSIIKPKMSVQNAAQELIKLVNNPAAVPYGIKQALIAKREAEAKVAEAEGDDTEKVRDAAQTEFDRALATIYANKAEQGLNVAYEVKFTPPRVKMHTEVTTLKDGEKLKKILSVFIYDDANTGYRSTNLISSIIQQDSDAATVFKNAGLTSQVPVTEVASGENTKTLTIDREYAKKIITASIPTLRIGTEGSLITNASFSTMSSGGLVDINLLRGIKNSGGASAAGTFPGIDADLYVMPTTLTITMAGMPFINRGQTFFVDFGTGTTLDNTYTVMTVKHSMRLGSFTTTVSLSITNQGSIKSVSSKLVTDLRVYEKYLTSTTPAPST